MQGSTEDTAERPESAGRSDAKSDDDKHGVGSDEGDHEDEDEDEGDDSAAPPYWEQDMPCGQWGSSSHVPWIPPAVRPVWEAVNPPSHDVPHLPASSNVEFVGRYFLHALGQIDAEVLTGPDSSE